MKTRGRPLKFGRPAELLAITLPKHVVRWLKRIHPDPAWAIVSLFEGSTRDGHHRRPPARPQVELGQLSAGRSLIVVDPHAFRRVPGVAVIPVAAGRAFLAFDEGKGIADLELGLLDRFDDPKTSLAERRELGILRRRIRAWRLSQRLRFSTRSIILAERAPRQRRGR